MGDCNSKCDYCEGKDAKGHTSSSCQSPSTCTCACTVGGGHDVAQKASAITAGVGLTIGGILLCLFTGGAAAPLVGAVVAGTGVSSAANGITKAAKGEKMDAADYFIDTTVGAASGALTAGGAVTGNLLKKAAEEGVKMTIKETTKHVVFKTGVMAVTGCAQAAMAEGINCNKPVQEGKEERKFNPHCLWVGAAVGAAGAAGSSLSKGAANKVANQFAKESSTIASRGVLKGATRLTGQTMTGAGKGAINAGGKLASSNGKGQFDGHEIWAGAATGAVSSVCSDVTGNLIKKAPKMETTPSPTTPSPAPSGTLTNGQKRFVIRAGSAVVETAATEGIQQAKQAASGEDDETRHFGKSFSIGLFESMNNKLGRYSEKHSKRKGALKKKVDVPVTVSRPKANSFVETKNVVEKRKFHKILSKSFRRSREKNIVKTNHLKLYEK